MTRVRALHISTSTLQTFGAILLAGSFAAESPRWLLILGVLMISAAPVAVIALESTWAARDECEAPFREAERLSVLSRTLLVQTRLGGRDTVTFQSHRNQPGQWDWWICPQHNFAWKVSQAQFKAAREEAESLIEDGLLRSLPGARDPWHCELTAKGRAVADAWISKRGTQYACAWGPQTT